MRAFDDAVFYGRLRMKSLPDSRRLDVSISAVVIVEVYKFAIIHAYLRPLVVDLPTQKPASSSDVAVGGAP
jgi:hypothetical protein